MTELESLMHDAGYNDINKLLERTTRSYRDRPDKDGWKHEAVYRFADGRRICLEGNFSTGLLFPATHGYFLLLFEAPRDADPETYDIAHAVIREPVIGWQLIYDYQTAKDFVRAVTTEGREQRTSNRLFVAFALPDGGICWHAPNEDYAGSDVLPSLEAWVMRVREVWQRKAKREIDAGKPCPTCGRRHLDYEVPF